MQKVHVLSKFAFKSSMQILLKTSDHFSFLRTFDPNYLLVFSLGIGNDFMGFAERRIIVRLCQTAISNQKRQGTRDLGHAQ